VTTRSAIAVAALGVLWLGGLGVARADVPGPRSVCDAEGRGCVSCWRSYRGADEDKKQYEECARGPKAKGMVEACSNRQGAGDEVYLCPPGANVPMKTVGGGCAGCAVGSTPLEVGSAALGLAVALGLARMGRSRSRSG
jgi:hypothetical protein